MSDGSLSRWDGRDVGDLATRWGVPRVDAWRALGSTNDRLMRLARDGAPAWTVVVADEQTKGRGRRGRAWSSRDGAGLWMSILAPVAPGRWPLPLVVGLACAEAVESLAPELVVGIKWPNDLQIGGRKVGGILCEGVDRGTVVGVGINVSHAPDDGSATALEVEMGKILARNDLAGAVIGRLNAEVDALESFGALIPRLESRDVLRGRGVESEAGGRGVAAGIDASGALLLKQESGEPIRVVAGSVRLSSERTEQRRGPCNSS